MSDALNLSVEDKALVARLIPGFVIEATERMYSENATDADAMIYMGSLATSILGMANVLARAPLVVPANLGADEGDCQALRGPMEKISDSARLCHGLAQAFEQKNFVRTAELARSVANALHSIEIALVWRNKPSPSCRDGARTKTYIVKSPESGLVKIGKSRRVGKRIQQLGGMAGARLSVLAVFDDDIERRLHSLFADLRVFGEWFRDDGRIAAYIAENIGGEVPA